jgi:hypothetical protein
MVLPAAIASSLIVSLVPVAHAVDPRAGCPPAFQGPLTFAQIIEMWPPPPGFPDPEGALAAYDMNADGMLCVMESPHGPTPAGPINVIDNVAAT